MVPEHKSLHERLLKESGSLNSIYSQAAFELRIGRVGGKIVHCVCSAKTECLLVKSIKPFIGIVENVRRELSWGMAFPRSSFFASNLEDSTASAFRTPALDLGDALLVSMKTVEGVILETFQNTSLIWRSLQTERTAVTAAREQLLHAREKARNELRKISDGLDMEQRTSNGEVKFPPEFFNLCLFMISLLQVKFLSFFPVPHAHIAQDGERDALCSKNII